MNAQYKEQILAKIQELKLVDIRRTLSEQYPDVDLANTILHGETTVGRFLMILDRILNQLEVVFSGDDWDLLPMTARFAGITSPNGEDILVVDHLNTILVSLKKKNWAASIPRIQGLAHYLNIIGRWKDKDSQGEIDQTRLESQLSRSSDFLAQAETLRDQYLSERNALNALKAEVEHFYVNKQKELKVIEQNRNEAATRTGEIGEKAVKAAEYLGELKSKAEEGGRLIEKLSKQEDNERTKFEELERRNAELQSQLDQRVREAEEAMQKAKAQQVEIESHRDEINKLLGLAADGALGQWFDDRKKLLRKALIRWTIAVPLAAVLAIAWAIIVFLVLRSATDNPYLDLGINIIKTVPAWVLLAFVLRQYRRERFMEEEYAFRAAISKTIKTYTDMLEKSDSEDNKSRNEMLREVLKQIYRMPRLQAEPKPPLMRVRSQDLPAILKEVNRAAGKVPAEEGE